MREEIGLAGRNEAAWRATFVWRQGQLPEGTTENAPIGNANTRTVTIPLREHRREHVLRRPVGANATKRMPVPVA